MFTCEEGTDANKNQRRDIVGTMKHSSLRNEGGLIEEDARDFNGLFAFAGFVNQGGGDREG